MNSNYSYFNKPQNHLFQTSQSSDSSDSSDLPSLTYEESPINSQKSDQVYPQQKQISNGVLNLSQRNIKETSQLELEEGIVALNLSKNQISDLGKLPHSIEGLNLSENKISTFPRAISLARNLRILNLSHNNLSSLDGIHYCSGLTELYLSHNNLNDNQLRNLSSLSELEVLDLSQNHLKDPRNIILLEGLLKLRVFINNMNEYTTMNFKKPSLMLEQIHLDDNNLNKLEFCSLKISVLTLSFKNNAIFQIKGLNNLQSIENLYCDNNQLEELDAIQSLENIKHLIASSNKLTKFIPPKLNHLESLDLSSNQLKDFDFLSECPHIKRLNISNNKITKLPPSQANLVSLTYLNIGRNAISSLCGLEKFPSLTELIVSDNSISHVNIVTNEVPKLKYLRNLDLRHNNFNSEFNFDSLIPVNIPLRSIEVLEKELHSSQEQLFISFVKYRNVILSNLSKSLTILDGIEVTDYEFTLAQKHSEISLTSLESFSSPHPHLFNLDMSLSYDASSLTNTARPKQAPSNVSSAIQSKRRSSGQSSPFTKEHTQRSKYSDQKKQNQQIYENEDSVLRESPSRMNTIKEEQDSQQSTMEFKRPEKSRRMGHENQNPRDSLRLDERMIKESGFQGLKKYEYSFSDEISLLPKNQFEGKLNFEKGSKRSENSDRFENENRIEEVRYSLQSQNQYRKSINQAQNSYKAPTEEFMASIHSNFSYEPKSFQKRTNSLATSVNQRTQSRINEENAQRRSTEPVIFNIETLRSIDREILKQQRDEDWRKVNDSLEISQMMIENLGRSTEKKNKPQEETPLRKSQQTYQKENEKKLQIHELQPTEGPTRRTESSFASEVAEELWNNYVDNLQDLKEKVKQTFQHRKEKRRSSSVIKSHSNLKSSIQDERDFQPRQSTYKREDPSEKHSKSTKYSQEISEYTRSRKISPSEKSNYNRSNYRPVESTHKGRRTQSVGRVPEIYNEYEREKERGRNERESYNRTMRKSSVNEMSRRRSYAEDERRDKERGRSEKKRERERSHKESSKFIKEMDNFLMEKFIERLDNEKKLSDNPYFKLYKEMLVEKGRLKSSYSGSRRTSHSQSRYPPSYSQSLKQSLRESVNEENDDWNRKRHERKPSKRDKSFSEKRQKPNFDREEELTKSSSSKLTKSLKKERNLDRFSPEKLQFEQASGKEQKLETINSARSQLQGSQKSETKEKQTKTPEQTPAKSEASGSKNQSENIQSKEEKLNESIPVEDKKSELETSLKSLNLGQKATMEQVKSIFIKNIPENQTFIDCSCIGGILIELFKELNATIEDKKLWKLLQEINDFIPRKLTAKTFLDLFYLPQTRNFIEQHNIPLDTTPIKSESVLNSSVRYSEKALNQSLSIGNKSSGLHSLSTITNTGLSPPRETETLKPFNRKDRESVSINKNSLPESRETQSRMSVVEKTEGEFGMISHLLNESSIHKTGGHHHSLSIDSSYTRSSIDELSLAHNYSTIKWCDLYGAGLGELFKQLMSYSLTPPKPIMGKEVQNAILKEVNAPSTESSLMSSILAYFGFMLKRAVKTYSFGQHKKLEKIIQEKKMLKPIQCQYGPMELKGRKLQALEDPSLIALKQENSLQFHNSVLLFHSAKLNKLSELIENANGFKEVYKDSPGDLIFSHQSDLCLRQYKRFMKRLDKKNVSKDEADSSFISGIQRQPRWRLLISQVFLGNCYIEKQNSFKEFAYTGEIQILELLKNGYTSVYFEKDELYLVLLAENCVPVYLCEYEFEEIE